MFAVLPSPFHDMIRTESMRVRVLGSGAGGGVPQWDCACDNCSLARAGDPRVKRRTQDSIAISARGDRWLLVNASPDVRAQIESFPPLQPRASRDTRIAAIALTNGDLDHVLGLLSLRELRVLATDRVREGLVDRNAMFRTLARTSDPLTWTRLELGREIVLDDVGVAVRAFPVAGKLPPHLAGLVEPSPEDNVALCVRDLASSRTTVVATTIGSLDGLDAILDGADALLLDGTFWSDEELVERGLGAALARDLAHVPVGGPEGSLARLRGVRAARRIFTRVNNTNPILRDDSPHRASVELAGWEVAFDGMELSL